MSKTFQLEVVSSDGEVYSGPAVHIVASGIEGELEILYGHAPLLTMLAPGPVWIKKPNGTEDGLVVFGGLLEVQPTVTTLLTDSVIRDEEIDPDKALETKNRLIESLKEPNKEFDFAKARADITAATAQLRILERKRKLRKS